MQLHGLLTPSSCPLLCASTLPHGLELSLGRELWHHVNILGTTVPHCLTLFSGFTYFVSFLNYFSQENKSGPCYSILAQSDIFKAKKVFGQSFALQVSSQLSFQQGPHGVSALSTHLRCCYRLKYFPQNCT